MNRMVIFISVLFSLSAHTHSIHPQGPAIIRSIDNDNRPRTYVEVSEEGLPYEHYLDLLESMDVFQFTILSEDDAKDLFKTLEDNSRARMNKPKGACSQRRAYIQSYLRKKNIISGRFLISCPANNGRLRLRDQVSRRHYTYSNYHDTNIVAVDTPDGYGFSIFDVQFENEPVSLEDYLSEIEDSQRIRPLKWKGSTSRLCYWTISTPYLTLKKKLNVKQGW